MVTSDNSEISRPERKANKLGFELADCGELRLNYSADVAQYFQITRMIIDQPNVPITTAGMIHQPAGNLRCTGAVRWALTL